MSGGETQTRRNRSASSAAPRSAAARGQPAAGAPSPKVLIVDDNVINRKLLRVTLQAEAYVVLEAGDGAAALGLIESERVDAVISDILMPVMDGYRLCYEIRKRDRWKRLPFIAYSSTYTSQSDEQTALEFGADKFIRKPASPAAILGALREAIDKAQQRDARALQLPEELKVMRNYSEVLVRKLEERNLDLNRANDEIKRNLDRIRALQEIGVAMSSTLDLGSVLQVLLEKIHRFIRYPSATTVRLLDQETGELRSAACCNIDEREWKKRENLKPIGRARRVLESRAPLIVRNVQTDPSTADRGLFRDLGLLSYLGVPLIAKDLPLGVLALYTTEERDFGAEEVEFMTALAGPAALAIYNSQLYDKTAKLASDLTSSNRQLRLSNKAKSQFLSVMSHELRTPLSVLIGYAGMLLEQQLGEVNTEQEKALGKILRHSHDLLTLIESIMEATKIESGTATVEPNDIDPLNLLEEIKLFYDVPTDKRIEFVWDFPPSMPFIRTDTGKVRQILLNLIDNAVKFTPEGKVTVSARIVGKPARRAPAAPESESWMDLTVSDTGVGIPEDEVANIFQLFQQIDSSETRLYGGVGLGLYIVHSFVGMLGGAVEVESRVGAGSTFKVRLPLRASAHAER